MHNSSSKFLLTFSAYTSSLFADICRVRGIGSLNLSAVVVVVVVVVHVYASAVVVIDVWVVTVVVFIYDVAVVVAIFDDNVVIVFVDNMNLAVIVMVAVVGAVVVSCKNVITIIIITISTTELFSTPVVDVLFIIRKVEVEVDYVNTRITRTWTGTSIVVFHLFLQESCEDMIKVIVCGKGMKKNFALPCFLDPY